jgi:hypothetical protein
MLTTIRPSLQASVLGQITCVYHFAPVICRRVLGGLMRQPRALDARPPGGTASDRAVDSFQKNPTVSMVTPQKFRRRDIRDGSEAGEA